MPVSRASAEHYRWGAGGPTSDGWHLLRSGELSVIEERMPPGATEVRHCHRRSRQFFYVLSGVLTMELEGVEHGLREGEGLEIGPGLFHQAMNPSEADARFLVVSQPPGQGDRVMTGAQLSSAQLSSDGSGPRVEAGGGESLTTLPVRADS